MKDKEPILPDLRIAEVSKRFHFQHQTEEWGKSILIIEKLGRAGATVYWYFDDNTTIYLAGLNVDKEIRRNGFGRKLQEIREQIGRNLGATISCLWVKKDSWMHEWYKRRGYSDLKDHETEENSVWMTKQLNGC